MKSNLYLLVFPQKNSLKIGKSDNIQNRINTIKRWWGDIDYESSYSVCADTATVFQLEKALHCLFAPHSIDFEEGDGKTEFFNLDVLDKALEHLRLYLSSCEKLDTLKKGIPKPIAPVTKSPIKNQKAASFRKKIKKVSMLMEQNLKQLDRFFRLVAFLLENEAKIPFQYDVSDDYIYFRIKDRRLARDRCFINFIRASMSYSVASLSEFGFVNFCSAITRSKHEDLTQFNLSFVDRTSRNFKGTVHAEIKSAFNKLPKKSIAVVGDLPIFK